MPTSSVAYHRINNCIERLIKIVGPGETQKHLGKLESKNLTDIGKLLTWVGLLFAITLSALPSSYFDLLVSWEGSS